MPRDRLPAAIYVELQSHDQPQPTIYSLGATVTPTADGWTARLDTHTPGLTVGGAASSADALARLLAHWLAQR